MQSISTSQLKLAMVDKEHHDFNKTSSKECNLGHGTHIFFSLLESQIDVRKSD